MHPHCPNPRGGTSGLGLILSTATALTASGPRSDDWAILQVSQNYPVFDRTGVFRTPSFVVPSDGDTAVLLGIYMTEGTYKLDRVGIFKAQRSGHLRAALSNDGEGADCTRPARLWSAWREE